MTEQETTSELPAKAFNSGAMDQDLQLALEAFGDDLLNVLNDGENDFQEIVSSSTDSEVNAEHSAAIRQIVEQFGNKLNENANLAYAGSIALACTSPQELAARFSERYLVFGIGQQRFGLPMKAIVEVVQPGQISPLPRTAKWLKGLTHLRGSMLSVTDLADLLEVPTDNKAVNRKMIVVKSDVHQASTGLLVERIYGLRQLDSQEIPDESEFTSTDDTGSIDSIFTSIVEIEDYPVMLISPHRLFGCESFAQYQ